MATLRTVPQGSEHGTLTNLVSAEERRLSRSYTEAGMDRVRGSEPTVAGVKPQLLQLNMTGSFRVLSSHNTSLRCGPKGVQRTIKYAMTINSSPDETDDRGFIIDWRDVSKAIAKKYRYPSVFPSCERIAQEIVALTEQMMGGRCSSISARVTISGLPANMVASWTSPRGTFIEPEGLTDAGH